MEMEMDEITERKDLITNFIIIGISMAVIAAVTIFALFGTDISDQGAGTIKPLLSICSKTGYLENCYRSLQYAGERGTSMHYIRASINVTLEEMKVVAAPKPAISNLSETLQALTYRDCTELLDLGIDELESLYNKACSIDKLSGFNLDDAIKSLSAVISYQQICNDALLQTNSYETIGYSLQMPILLARITLAIVDGFSDKRDAGDVHAFGFNSRRLLAAAELGNYPTWFSPADRKLLESQREQPNAVVAQDGSGQFSSITEAIMACQKYNMGSCTIYVKQGKYEEKVVIPKNVSQVFMYGDGCDKTVVTGARNRGDKNITTFEAATFTAIGSGFICKDMAFIAPLDIDAAPAILVLSDRSAFFNCKIQGEEGSLFAAANRQFYRDCEIRGNVDIIKGDSATVIQNSEIIVKKQNGCADCVKPNVVSAQLRSDKHESTGFVIQNCSIIADKGYTNIKLGNATYLGAPYKEYSRAIIMESFLGDCVHPEGWYKWSDDYGTQTATFLEYKNLGPGAVTEKRVNWQGYDTTTSPDQVAIYTAGQFIQADQWLPTSGFPYISGFVS